AAGVLAIEPTVAYWNNQLTTESVFTVSVLAATYCFLAFLQGSPRRFVFYAGFFLGFALLIRPITEYLGIIFLAALFILGVQKRIPWKRLVFGAAIFAAGYFITVTPWMIRNQLLFGTTSVSTMNVGFGKYLKAIQKELGISVNYAFYGGIPRTEVERLALVRADALRLVAQHPFLFVKIHLIGLVPFFLGDGYGTTFGVLFPALRESRVVTDWSGSPAEIISFLRGHTGLEGVVFWGGKFIWGALVFAALVGAGLLLKAGGWNRRFAIFFLLIVYYFALASGVGSYSRFRFPVNPYIFIFTAVGSTAAINWLRSQYKKAV
ncbi:MAG: glycosyltransferase family 39 protein, partial [Patescibacteria group bacterium]